MHYPYFFDESFPIRTGNLCAKVAAYLAKTFGVYEK